MASSYQPEGSPQQQAADLEATRNLLKATLDSSMDMIQVFEAERDEQGKIVDFTWVVNNHASEKIYGKVVGESLLALQPGVVEEGIFDAFKQVVETGLPQQYEKHYVHEQFHGWFYQSVVKLNDGVATTTTDITDRKKAEQELQQSQAFLQSVIDSSLDIIQVFKAVRDESGFILDFVWVMNNQKAIEQNGDVIGKSLLKQNPGVVQTGIFDRMIKVAQTGVPLEHEQYYAHEQFAGWFYQALVKTDEGVAMTTRDITEQKHAQQEVLRLNDELAQKATDKYRTLFETIDEGFAVQELVFDQHGEIADLIYREANAAFEKHTGLAHATGKRASEVFPHIEQGWFDALKQVYQTGVPQRMEGFNTDTQRWLTAHYSPIGGQGSPFIAAVFQDITQRKQREQHQAFLLHISDALRAEPDGDAIATRALQLLAEHLQLDRCYVGVYRLAEDRGVFPYQVGNDRVPAMPQEGVRLSDFPEALRIAFDKTLIITNFHTTEGLTATDKRNFDALGFGALVVATVRKGEKIPLWAISAVSARPRQWTPLEIQLVEEVAERTWSAIERANIEKAYRESEERLRMLFDTMNQGVAIMELVRNDVGQVVDCRYLAFNPAFNKLIGLDRQSVTGRLVSEVFPQHFASFQARLETVEGTAGPEKFEACIPDIGRWFSFYATPFGGPDGFVVFYDDITERKQQERQQAFLLNFSDTLRTLQDKDTIENRSLQLLSEFLGLDRTYVFVLYPSEDRAVVSSEQRRADLLSLLGEVRMSDFPETVRQIEDETLVINDIDTDARLSVLNRTSLHAVNLQAFVCVRVRKGEKNIIRSLAAATITPRIWTRDEVALIETVAERTWAAVEQAKVEEALRRLQQRTRLAVEAAQLATWEWNLKTGEVYWNERHFTLLGMPLRNNPVRAEDFLSHVHPDDQDRINHELNQTIQHQTVYDVDFRIRRPDGVVRWMSGYGRVTEVEQEVSTRLSGVMFDITTRKEAEEALKQADRRKNEFLALLAHELRNPLATLSNTLLLLQLTKSQDASLPMEKALTMMSQEVTQLARLVDDLLDVSRINQSKASLRLQPLELGKLVNRVAESVRQLIEQQQLQFIVRLPSYPLYLLGDEIRLTQILRNLLGNATKFTPEKGHIWLSLEQVGQEAVLRVEDNGIGIPADQLKRIFEQFAQVDGSISRSQGGLGLGLTLAQHFTHLHGGRLEAHSQGVGRGSEFIVYLPLLNKT